MRCIIAGSRRFPKYGISLYKDWADASRFAAVYGLLEQAVIDSRFDITTVVSGTCWGVDRVGEIWAAHRKLPVIRYPANWPHFGKAAGPVRNKAMSLVGDCCIAIYTEGSKGTLNMIENMKKQNKPVFTVEVSRYTELT